MQNYASRQVPIVHCSTEVMASFDAFTREFERLAGRFDPSQLRGLTGADETREKIQAMQGEQGLMIFAKLDHGFLFALDGKAGKAFRYHVGNPLIAYTMTRHDIRAALYAPLTLIVFEVDSKTARVEFDLPSSLFGSLGNPETGRIGLQLDDKLKVLIDKAAEFAANGA
jgi:Domain of unknown function DUF302